MDDRQMHAVLVIARNGSIAKAADELHISPQGLQKRLNAIESALGCPLFIRSKSGCIPTKAGEEFCQLAPDLLNALDDFKLAVLDAEDAQFTLKIASWGGRGNAMEDRIALKFREHHPDVKLRYVNISATGVVDDIEHGVSDVAFTYAGFAIPARSGVTATPLPRFRMGYRCILAADDPLAGQALIRPESLTDRATELIVPDTFNEPPDGLFGASLSHLRLLRNPDRLQIVDACLSGEICIADEFFSCEHPSLVTVPLDVPPTYIEVLHRKSPSTVVSLFLRTAEKMTSNMPGSLACEQA